MAEQNTSGAQVPAIIRFKEILDRPKTKEQFALVLQKEERVERFLRIITTQVSTNTDLLQCSIDSVMSCALQGAQLNLDPEKSLGQFYLIPRGGVCTFQLGYQGMIQLALRSGKIRSVIGRVAYKSDDFEAVEGTNGYIRHTRNLRIDSPPDLEEDFLAAYAVAHFTRKIDEPDDFEFVVMAKWQVDRIRNKFSKGYNGSSSPWKTSPDAMRAKTAVRQLFKFLQVSAEMNLAITLDEAAEEGIDQPINTSFTMPTETEKKSKLESLKDTLKAKKGAEEPAIDVSEDSAGPEEPSAEKAPVGSKDDIADQYVQRIKDLTQPEKAEESSGDNETTLVPDWSNEGEQKEAVSALRAELSKVAAELRKKYPDKKDGIPKGIKRATEDTLGIFGCKTVEGIPKAQWGEFRDLLISTVQGLSDKIGEGGESELRRKLFVALKTEPKAKAGVEKLKKLMGVDNLSDIPIIDLGEAESQIAAMKEGE